LDGAKAAASRADVPQNHEGGGALIPAFADIRAGRAFAHGVEAEAADQVLQFLVVSAGRRGGAQPLRPFARRGNRTELFLYCTGGAATPTDSAALTRLSQLPCATGIPLRRRSASVRHSGSPATSTSS